MKNIFNFLQAFFLFRYTVDDNYTNCHRETISLKDTILTMKKIAATFLVSPKVKNTFFLLLTNQVTNLYQCPVTKTY